MKKSIPAFFLLFLNILGTPRPLSGDDEPPLRDLETAVFVATMGDFKTPSVSGQWHSWNSAGEGAVPHDPGRLLPDGKRDIASVYYPAVGPYDMSDPDLAEYHCQLLKMAGIDGISFNLNFHEPWRVKSMKAYVAAMRRYDLKAIARFEDKWHYDRHADRSGALREIYSDMEAWLKQLEPVQYKVGGRPVFMLFTFRMSPAELGEWKRKHPSRVQPLIVTLTAEPPWRDVVDGTFGWCGLDPDHRKDVAPFVRYVDTDLVESNQRANTSRALEQLKSGAIRFYMAGVSPGFDDRGCWGWGQGPRKVERHEGKTYRYRWDKTLESGWPVVLIPTWNDWMEGTVIEPTLEDGVRYLEITREYVKKLKKKNFTDGDLRLPVWIYKIRKTAKDEMAGTDMDRASDLILAGRYKEAEDIVAPWVRKLDLGKFAPWDSAADR